MSFMDPSYRFTRLRRWLAGDRDLVPPSLPSWQERIYCEVGQFLFDNHLAPTPDHYDLAYQFRAAASKALVEAVRTEIASAGGLSADAADRIFAEHAGPLSPHALAEMTEAVGSQMDDLSGIAKQSVVDAAEFHGALASDPSDVAKVMALTRAMIARTRTAEAQLRGATKELQGLRAHLAEAQHFADVDPLTELANRRAFKRHLEKAIREAEDEQMPLSLGFIDLDHFKLLNDSHGHETGDRVLRFVAQLMTRHFADMGLVGRFGGEEFVVMLPRLTRDEAAVSVDACRAALADLPLFAASTGERIGAVTFTAGVTSVRLGEGITDLLRRADEILYRGKAAGRNRVLTG